MIYFPAPSAEERLRLWQQGLPPAAKLASEVDLQEIASRHTLAGGAIMNVVRYASLQALARGEAEITEDDLMDGIRRELAKEGKGE